MRKQYKTATTFPFYSLPLNFIQMQFPSHTFLSPYILAHPSPPSSIILFQRLTLSRYDSPGINGSATLELGIRRIPVDVIFGG